MSERLAAAIRGAVAGAVFRLVAVWLGLGVLELAGTSARWVIVRSTQPGDGTGPLGMLVGFYRSDGGGGDAWALYFLATTSVLFALQVAALVWALRPDRPVPPALLFSVGLAGLVARVGSFGANALISIMLGRDGVESLAAYSIASNANSMAHMCLQWTLAVTVLIVLFVRLLRQPRLDERDGYREPPGLG